MQVTNNDELVKRIAVANTQFAYANADASGQNKAGNTVTIKKEIVNYAISQNYPNPFNPATTINYQIPKSNFVILKIYDLLGREVRTLVNEEQPTGEYTVTFNAGSLASGLYFYTLRAGNFTQTKKMMLLK